MLIIPPGHTTAARSWLCRQGCSNSFARVHALLHILPAVRAVSMRASRFSGGVSAEPRSRWPGCIPRGESMQSGQAIFLSLRRTSSGVPCKKRLSGAHVSHYADAVAHLPAASLNSIWSMLRTACAGRGHEVDYVPRSFRRCAVIGGKPIAFIFESTLTLPGWAKFS